MSSEIGSLTLCQCGNTMKKGKSVCDLCYNAITKPNSYSIIDDNAIIGKNVKIGNFCEIRKGCIIGSNTRFGSRCTLAEGTVIGKNCDIKYGFVATDTPNLNRPNEKSSCRIGNNVLIGANVCVMPNVRIDDFAKIDTGITVFYDVQKGQVLRNPQRLKGEPQ